MVKIEYRSPGKALNRKVYERTRKNSAMSHGFIHSTASVSEKATVGEGTTIWHHSQVRENAVIGTDCILGKGVYIDCGVTIGNACKIQNYACIYQGVSIADEVFIGPHVTFTNDLYPRSHLWNEDRLVKTVVKEGASIGANATILCGITIGTYAMIGAGSVVTKDVPPHTLVRGNPAERVTYVCMCGHPLTKQGSQWVCPVCNKPCEVNP
jgi:acetyltransferase-like isoleucine patch superfamily enzyme